MQLLRPLNDPQFATASAAYTGTAGSTTTWPAGPQGVMVWSDQACYVRVGEAVTATTADTPIPPFTPIPFSPTLEKMYRIVPEDLYNGIKGVL